MQLLGLAADQEDRFRVTYIAVGGERRAQILEEGHQRESFRRRVTLRADRLARKFQERIVGFVSDSRTADDCKRVPSIRVNRGVKFLGDVANGFIPCSWNKLAAFLALVKLLK